MQAAKPPQEKLRREKEPKPPRGRDQGKHLQHLGK